MRVIRFRVGGAGPGDPPGRWSRRLIGWGLVIGIGLPILIAAGVGVGLYQTFFKVPELRALLFEGGRVARGAVLPVADGAVVLSQENAQPVAEVIRSGARQAGEARVYLTRIARLSNDKPRWDVVLDGVTGPAAGQVRLWRDGERVLERPNRLAYEVLDLRTGRPLKSATTEVEAASWEGVAWSDDAVWLTIASPYRVDLRDGAVARAWPWQSLANCQNIGGKIVCTR